MGRTRDVAVGTDQTTMLPRVESVAIGCLLSMAVNLAWSVLACIEGAISLATLDMGEAFGDEFAHVDGPPAWPLAATGVLLALAAGLSVRGARRLAPLRRTWRQWSIPFVVALVPLNVATWFVMVELEHLLLSI